MVFVIGRLEECKNYFIIHLDIKEQSTTTSIIEKLPKLKMIKVLNIFLLLPPSLFHIWATTNELFNLPFIILAHFFPAPQIGGTRNREEGTFTKFFPPFLNNREIQCTRQQSLQSAICNNAIILPLIPGW